MNLSKGRGFLAVLLFVVTGLLSLPAVAQERIPWPSLSTAPQMEQVGEDDVAVIVAIDDYAFLPNVPGAVENANDWENFFRRGLGMRNVYVLTNRDATREAMVRFARQAVEDAKPHSTVWFLFIGHGSPVQNGADGGLVGMDALQNVESLDARSLTQTELLEILEAGPQAKTVVAVDACFSGRAGDGEALAVGMQPVIPVNIQPVLSGTTVVLSAARADQYAGPLPGMERPAFTYLLLGALRGWADGGTGEVRAEDAVLYARQQLRGVPGRQQTPEIFGPGEVVLVRGVSEPDPVQVWREEEARRREAELLAESEIEEATEEMEVAEEGKGAEVIELVEVEKRERGSIAWGPVVMGVGGAAILGAVVTGVVSQATLSQVDPASMTQLEAAEIVDRSNRQVVTAGVLAGVGVATAGVGFTLWRSNQGDQKVSTTVGGGGDVAVSWQVRW